MSANLLGDLANATKALNAHRFGVTTAGNNLANVNNPDYARQRVMLGERGTVQTLYGPQGLGVEVVGFQQMRDVVLDREVLRETSINASLEAQSAALSKAEASIGQEITRAGDTPFIDGATSDGSGSGGIAEAINDFFNAFHSLSANPGSDAEKEALVQRADILAEKLNVTAERFNDLKGDLTLQVETDLSAVNRLTEEIARLNAEIARAESGHAGQALGLRDQRQGLLEQLSEFVQVKTENIENSAGQVRVYIPANDPSQPSVDLVNLGNFKKIEFDSSDDTYPVFSISAGGPEVDIRGGSIHGSLLARNGPINGFLKGLDNLAGSLVTAVNAIYSAGGNDFFDASGLSAATISLDGGLNSASLYTSSTGEKGNNDLILAIAELDESQHLSLGNRSFSSYYRSIATDLGENTSKVESRLEDESIVFQLLKEQQDSVSGVSIDEEMTDMMKFQRAYEATGKLIKAIDEMLDVVVNRLI